MVFEFCCSLGTFEIVYSEISGGSITNVWGGRPLGFNFPKIREQGAGGDVWVVVNSRFLWVVASSEMACPRQANSSLPRLQIASRLAINSGAGWARQRGRVRPSVAGNRGENEEGKGRGKICC